MRLTMSQSRSCWQFGRVDWSSVEKTRMYPLGSGYRNTVDRVGFLAPHPNLDHPRIILNKFANCLPAQAPEPSKIGYAVVPLESRVLN
jgi:hypothetical protein